MDAMSFEDFWALIEQTTVHQADTEKQEAALREKLMALTSDDVARFGLAFDREMKRSYTWDLWGAAYVVHGGASDDSFHYFRQWLISKGQNIFETVLKAPDDLADLIAEPAGGPLEFEEFSYVASDVWGIKTNKDTVEMPFNSAYALGDDPNGEEFEEDDTHLAKRYPKLWARFGETPIG